MSFIKIQYFEHRNWVPINFSKIKIFKGEVVIGRPFRILVNDEVIFHADKNGVLKEVTS